MAIKDIITNTLSLVTFYDFTVCTPTITDCKMYDPSDASLVLPLIQIIANNLVFGSY